MDKEFKNLQEHQWRLSYDRDSNTAKMINEKGETMDLSTFSHCLDALQNEFSDLNEINYGSDRKEPLDEFTIKRLELYDYKLIGDSQGANYRRVFEVYSDSNGIFTLDNYVVIDNRKRHRDFGFIGYLNHMDAKKLLESLENFVESCSDLPNKY